MYIPRNYPLRNYRDTILFSCFVYIIPNILKYLLIDKLYVVHIVKYPETETYRLILQSEGENNISTRH